MFSEEINENIPLFLILPRDLPLKGNHRPQIVIRIPKKLVKGSI